MTQQSGWHPEQRAEDQARADTLERGSLRDLLSALVADARAFAAAEAERYKLRGALAGSCVKVIGIAGVLALFLLFALVIGGVIGLVWALAPLLGPWGALGAVMFGGLLLLAILGIIIARQVALLKKGWRV